MKTLSLVHVETGRVLDRVSLVGGRLKYETGQAMPVFDSLRRTAPTISDAELFRRCTGWSDGYRRLADSDEAAVSDGPNPTTMDYPVILSRRPDIEGGGLS